MKVIIVGNAASLLNKTNGKLIDSFDKVIRCNECIINGYEQFTGSKTDILAVPANEILERIINKKGKTSNEDYINNVSEIWYTRFPKWVEKTIKTASLSIYNNKTFKYISDKDFDYINDIFKGVHYPSTGAVAVYLAITRFTNHKIFITGFDGFQTNHYYSSEETDKEIDNVGKFHHSCNEIKYISDLLSNNIIYELE